MKIRIETAPLLKTKADAWLIFCRKNQPLLPKASDSAMQKLEKMIRNWIADTGFKSRAGEITFFPSREALPSRFIMLGGLGEKEACAADVMIKTAGAAARAMRKLKIGSVAISADVDTADPSVTPGKILEWIVGGLSTGHYRFGKFLSTENGRPPAISLIVADARNSKKKLLSAAREASVLSETVTMVRDLANLPANEAPPRVIAQHASAWAKKFGLSCSVLGPRELKKKGCRALLAVAQGSDHDARLITLKYRGRNPRLAPVILVGKTITFDTGGLSLKTAKGMEWMKYDKCGGMAVLAAMIAVARLRPNNPVIGILAAAENMPGGGATRPGDIVRSYSGKTIEILNTDAEGRLVLADALAIAAEYKPAAIVDLATLTGACIIALGHVLAGIMGNNATLIEELKIAGEATGDRVWPLPLLPDFDDCIRSDFADMKNIGDGSAGSIIGGVFLKQFIPPNVPWAHLDIAGTAHLEKEKAYAASGATLFGTRLLVEWIKQRDKQTKHKGK